jgi:hypothetical protein
VLLFWGRGDDDVVNCLEPHPFLPGHLATSGIDDTIKVWAPTAAERRPVSDDAERVIARNRQARHAMLTLPQDVRAFMRWQRRRRLAGLVDSDDTGEEEEDFDDDGDDDGVGGGSDDSDGGCRVS